MAIEEAKAMVEEAAAAQQQESLFDRFGEE